MLLGASRPECRYLTAAARRRGSLAGAEAVRAQADAAYADLRDFVASPRPDLSFARIAAILNLRGHTTRRGRPFTASTVHRLCQRFGIG